MQKEDIEKGDLLNYLADDARKAREAKHENQMKMILKNRLPDLNNHFYMQDENHSGKLIWEKFEYCVKKLGINENIILDKDIKRLFDKHKIDGHNVDYRDVLKDLRNYKFEYDDVYQHHEESLAKNKPKKGPFDDVILPEKDPQLNIVDIRQLPTNSVEKCYQRSKKISKHLKRLFPTRKDFEEISSQVLGLDKEKVPGKEFTKTEIKEFFDSIFNKTDLNIPKKEFEGFFSSFLYNQQGMTDFNEIAFTIYE